VLARSLVLALVLSGCDLMTLLYGDTSAPPVAPPVTPSGAHAGWKIDVGTGESDFEPLNDGDVVAKQHGPQGGYHVWISLRIDGATPEEVQLQIEVTGPGDALVSRSLAMADPRPDPAPATTKTLVGQRAFVDADTTGAIVVHVKLIDPSTEAWASADKPLVLK
jgi:hypothetical protein